MFTLAEFCHTDLAAKLQHMPVPLPKILGHEGAGVVVKTGAGVTRVRAGDHVLMSFGSCGLCDNCAEGHPGYCDHFRPINMAGQRSFGPSLRSPRGEIGGHFFAQSSFATYALATERNVVKIDEDLPLHLLAPLGCGIQTGMGTVLLNLQPTPGSSIAIFGAGAVGLAAVIAAKIAGCGEIIAVDIKEARLEVARDPGSNACHIGRCRRYSRADRQDNRTRGTPLRRHDRGPLGCRKFPGLPEEAGIQRACRGATARD